MGLNVSVEKLSTLISLRTQPQMYFRSAVRYPDLEHRFLYRIISVISVVLRENTLTISVSTREPVSMESEIVRVVSFDTTEISEKTRLKSDLQCPETLSPLLQELCAYVCLPLTRSATYVP